LPNRSARVLSGYTFLGKPVDVIETSRGCTFDCGFCSIIAMRGRNFHTYSFDRVLADIADAKAYGARAIFLVDDNVVLNVHRFEQLCEAIIAAGHHDVEYLVQAMTSAIAQHGRTLAPLMRRAGFRYVFLGIENVIESDLQFLRAKAKNKLRTAVNSGQSEAGFSDNATMQAIKYIRGNGMYVVGGLIVGNPGDTAESIETNLQFAEQHVDWPYIQHPTPYPGTPMTADFRARDLVTNERLEEYDGTTAVVKTEQLAPDEIEFLRWRAERWMKVRHVPSVIRRHPGFVLKHWHKMLAHTFRGSTWRTIVGWEDERDAFVRYKTIRASERSYL
jgi:anaerobic magnesium-protoporphyrin IX monomethyl ester cyclase